MLTPTEGESSSSQFHGTSSSSTNNNKGAPPSSSSNKIISIESTADGDITTVEERTMTSTSVSPRERIASDSIAAFKNHLRDSWDEEGLDMNDDHSDNIIDGLIGNNEDQAALTNSKRSSQHHRSRHRQNLSVQFLEFSISGDDGCENNGTTNTTAPQPRRRRRPGKETIEGSASYYFNPPSPPRNNAPSSTGEMESNSNNCPGKEARFVTDSNSSNNNNSNTVSKFTNALHDSWKRPSGQQQQDRNSLLFLDDAKPKCFKVGEQEQEQQHHHQQQQQQQRFSAQEGIYPQQSSEGSENAITEAANSNTTSTSPADAIDPPASATTSANAIPCEKQPLPQLPSHENAPEPTAIIVDHHRLPGMIQPLRLESDSPISPSFSSASCSSEITDIIAPIPLRPSGSSSSLGGSGSGGNRKHRRVFSGKSNPALVHRRVNTRGDKCAQPGEDVFEAETNELIEGQHVHHDRHQHPQQL